MNDTDTLDLNRIALMLRRRYRAILGTAGVVTLLALLASTQLERQYDATAILLAGQSQGLADVASIQAITASTQSLASLATDRVVMEEAIERRGLQGVTPDGLRRSTTTTVRPETQAIQITVRDSDPRRARRHANAVAGTFSELVEERRSKESTLSAAVWQRADEPEEPSAPNVRMIALIAVALGLLLGIAIAAVRERRDPRWREERDFEEALDLPVLALVPTVDPRIDGMGKRVTRGGDRMPLITNFSLNSTIAESYRMLRTNLLLGEGEEPPRCIVVTSSERGEGKSLTTANLGVVMARSDRSVVVVDADLRLPAQHRIFGVPRGKHGYSAEFLGPTGDAVTPELIRNSYVVNVLRNLDLIPAGIDSSDPSETVGARRFERFIDALLEMYDVVLIDSPPVSRVTDSVVMSSLADGVLLVADFGGHRNDTSRAVQSLRRVDAPLLGVVVNRYDRDRRPAYASAYGGAVY